MFASPTAWQKRFAPVPDATRSGITARDSSAQHGLVAPWYTMNDDVVLSKPLQDALWAFLGTQSIEGTMMATGPVQICIDGSAHVQVIQEQGHARAAYEHLGIQNIRLVSVNVKSARNFKIGGQEGPAEAMAESARCRRDTVLESV